MSAGTGSEAQTTVATPAAATLTEQAVAPVPVAAATPAPRKSMGPSANLAGPVDVRESPTAVNDLANERSLSWFENNVITRVPTRFAGRGRQGGVA